MAGAPHVSVLMPTHAQAAFLPRAVGSLLAQTFTDWELVVVDDGSPDHVGAALAPFAGDPRVRLRRLEENVGLGAALNQALSLARGAVVAYLPSDDLYHADHLDTLLGCLGPGVALAYSPLASAPGPAPASLQLVQVLHPRTADSWVERPELESDDLERLFWSRLRARGRAVESGRVTCEWVVHPAQRHRAIRESLNGGLNVFRSRYRVREPLRFQSSDSGLVDEVARYARFREQPDTPRAPDGLRILLVGELAYNPERVLALEERGHELHGLWIADGLGFNTVGPLPFGHVREVPRDGWRDAVRRLAPDVIYAGLNWRAVPLAHAVLEAELGVPFVWHYKEAPQRSLLRGEWPLLADLHARSDARLYSSPQERDWLEAALPGRADPARTLVLDGDLPKREWFAGERSRRLSSLDGGSHTVVIGRPQGLDPPALVELTRHDVHLHAHGAPVGWQQAAVAAAPRHVHIHASVGPEEWVQVLSRYDAGWLHRVDSRNAGDVRRATWDDLNLPARIPTYMAGGLPLLQNANPGALVATQELIERLGIGLLFDGAADVAGQLSDRRALEGRRRAVTACRSAFTFDHHADRLVELMRAAVAG